MTGFGVRDSVLLLLFITLLLLFSGFRRGQRRVEVTGERGQSLLTSLLQIQIADKVYINLLLLILIGERSFLLKPVRVPR